MRRWLELVVATPGLTAIQDSEEAWRVHVEESLAAIDVVQSFDGAIVDVGSGGGAPGIPLAAALPTRKLTLLDANGRKAAFLERISVDFSNVRVVRGRAEEQPLEEYGVAVAKALASPPVALEWCLPLVHAGGAAVLYVGHPDLERAALAAATLGGGAPELIPVTGSERQHLLVVRKVRQTPTGFPRRAGAARKRPLA